MGRAFGYKQDLVLLSLYILVETKFLEPTLTMIVGTLPSAYLEKFGQCFFNRNGYTAHDPQKPFSKNLQV